MRLVRGYVNPPPVARGAVVAIGNFDGVHKGHQAIIRIAHDAAQQIKAPLGVVSFEPHPRALFQKEKQPFRLTPLRGKLRLLNALGVDVAIVFRFDANFAAISAESFAAEILGQKFAVRHVVVGYDFAFGHRRQGNPELLVRAGRKFGYGVTVVDPQTDGREIFASSRVRDFLVQGRLENATNEFGRFWEVEGHVQHGDARGATIGFPTANINLGEFVRPALGVYAVRVGLEDGGKTNWHDGVANLGRRPTFGGDDVILEVHLFDFQRDLYGQRMRVAFVDHLRPEIKFDGIDALKDQISADCETARALLRDKHDDPNWFANDNLLRPIRSDG
ncbi:MAG: bifunctional riboflavin kinase/FAD synthetase [Proteobacteria bacterium]|nr:bifunctional riboflavin kinase/FAD synthetase [Pseudomonadota bacterium]